MQSAFEFLFRNELLDRYILELTLEQVAIAEALAVMFFVIGVVYNVAIAVVRSRGMQPIDFGEFARAVVMMFALGLYIPLVSFPVTVLDIINRATQPSQAEVVDYSTKLGRHTYENGIIGVLQKEFVPDPENPTDQENDVQTEELSLWSYLGIALSPTSFGSALLDMVTVSLASVVRIVIQAVLKILSLIFFVFGPYAWVVSILPIWRDRMVIWFNSFITIYFTYVVFNILDRILYYNLFKDLFSAVSQYQYAPHQSLALNLSILVVYLLPFWISGKIVGSSDAGRFLSMFFQVGTAMASTGLSKLGGFRQLAAISGKGGALAAGGAAKDAMSPK